MSRGKKYTSIGMDGELLQRVRDEAERERRSLGFIFEKMTKAYFRIKGVEAGKEVTRNAD